ncbi:MAG TPA: NUDIX hydrolase [Ktedonobacteraceae bacterium]|nr:NUDIX hydrolase [Ktedonobacteraceae bacterium]
MIEFEILARGLYRPDQLVIDYDPSLRMPTTPQIRNWMDRVWQERLAFAREHGARLFDGALFRFVDAGVRADGTLCVLAGATGYKEYVATRMPEFAQIHERRELGNALAVCSVIETSDGFILLERRPETSAYAGRYHVIGGFFERDRDMGARPDAFGAMRREIREETGIQTVDIREQYCLGLVYDLALPHAEFCFVTRLRIPLDDVLHQRTPEDDEIVQLHTLPVSGESLRGFVLAQHGNISTTGEANLLLYGGWKFGDGWFEEIMRSLSSLRSSEQSL